MKQYSAILSVSLIVMLVVLEETDAGSVLMR